MLIWRLAVAALEVEAPLLPVWVALGVLDPDPPVLEPVGEAVPLEAAADVAEDAASVTLELPQTMVFMQLACWLCDWAFAARQSPRAVLQMKLSMVGL